jgi:hypothetical protein
MDDGQTLETHLVSYMKQSGVCPPQLDIPPIPYEAEHIWDWWLQLQATRPIGMASGHITYTEIANWSKLLKINVTDFEVRCIMAVDSAFLSVQNEQHKRKAASSKKQ